MRSASTIVDRRWAMIVVGSWQPRVERRLDRLLCAAVGALVASSRSRISGSLSSVRAMATLLLAAAKLEAALADHQIVTPAARRR